ncbi:hypothetical protein VEx25_B0152 [Vibrio antiquarius]|uniref:Uncharacterized protein n=1 Tax=Vibrio antiquarius (strain Ex25) TaxID=150340 RepID=A0ABM9WXH7_VIBAE|nr:hypothetical protein VEx25_B0152 [Vibrio antiquarius]
MTKMVTITCKTGLKGAKLGIAILVRKVMPKFAVVSVKSSKNDEI